MYHLRRDILGKFRRVLPPNDPTVVDRSLVFGASYAARNLIAYSVETRGIRLIVSVPSQDRVEAIIEPLDDEDIRRSCQEFWRTCRRAGRWYGVRIASLRLVDPATGETVARGETGWGSAVSRRDLWFGFATAAATALWLVIALPTFAHPDAASTIVGAIPALVVGLVSVGTLIAVRNNLQWRLEGWD